MRVGNEFHITSNPMKQYSWLAQILHNYTLMNVIMLSLIIITCFKEGRVFAQVATTFHQLDFKVSYE